MQHIVVSAFWDEEASVWVAESEDVPGLITEAPTLEALAVKLEGLIPELLEANQVPLAQEVQVRLEARRDLHAVR